MVHGSMTQILTFLGKGGIGRTTVAIATAKQQASQGKRVLLASQGSGPELSLLLGLPTPPGTDRHRRESEGGAV